MDIRWGLFGWNKRVYARVSEQELIAKELGLPKRSIYYGGEANMIHEWGKGLIRKGEAEITWGEI